MSVRVAVRIRPFNSREKEMNATCCCRMEGPKTFIRDPETKKEKDFTFDFSYWSHDGFKEEEGGNMVPAPGTSATPGSVYATQRMVFDDLGRDVMASMFDGYNSCLFAYGQTGAGKSYSMVGYGSNRGIIPIVCEEMFKQVERGQEDPNQRYQVVVTMLEIYNEVIRDLLNPAANKAGGLKVRSKPEIGVYVEGLTPVAVSNYPEIEKRMDEGTANRTVASTKMNATSSRAHTVFGLIFNSQKKEGEVTSETSSRINLVDLAGSERAESTGATGDRLKEGCAINASLSALGNVISALAERAMGKKKVFIPYRNSALTRLLQDALGGNSKTIMIAALSPADVNYDETLGTLRYADRAKKIKNKVTKMENPTDKIIRVLKEENSRLMALLEGKGISAGAVRTGEEGEEGEDGAPAAAGGGGGGGGRAQDPAEVAEMKAKLQQQMEENNKMMEEMKKSWEQKVADSSAIKNSSVGETGGISAREAKGTALPHILNLHEDSQLSEIVVYVFKKGTNKIGRKQESDADEKMDIILAGLNIARVHATVTHSDDGKVKIEAVNKSKTFVNGDLVAPAGVELHHGDRVVLGNNFVFRYCDPIHEAEAKESKVPTFASAMEEFSEKQGLRLSQSLSGEMGKLEKEEQEKRKELEDKLREMEEKMKKERESARAALELQKKSMAGRDSLTEEEKKRLAEFEQSYENTAKDLEDKMAKRKEMAEQMFQEQQKRKRTTKKIEAQLAALMPLVNEANSMADELRKQVRFEARLAVKASAVSLSALDEMRNLKQIEVTIRVVSQANGNVWTWNTTKFDNRLFLMREVYQDFLQYGPRDVPKSKDPFWDPPEAIEIGKAYVYLKALSQLVEIENEFSIVDYKGDEQGKLAVDIYPETLDGGEVDYLTDSTELIGKGVQFLVRIAHAKGIPAKFSNDVYVGFSFNGDHKETEPCEKKSTEPKFKFEHRFRVESINEQVRQYLLKDACIFEVKGYSDPQIDIVAAESKGETKATAGGAAAAGGRTMCEQCEEKDAALLCNDCSKNFCGGCFDLLHKSAKKAGHSKTPLAASTVVVAAAAPAAAKDKSKLCFQCEEKSAGLFCTECDKQLCDGCNELLHKSAKKKEHNRRPLDGAAATPATAPAAAAGAAGIKCQQCDENPAKLKCENCNLSLCDNCNGVLHRSAKKADHVRTPI